MEWCDRRLLARIHRYTLNRLRAEIEPVSAAEFMRFLLHWQRVAADARVNGAEGLAAVIDQLDGYELAAAAWEHDVLPARVRDYGPEHIDMLCLSGRVAWGRLTPMDGAGRAPLKSSPIALMAREHAALWRSTAGPGPDGLTSEARAVHAALRARGAQFFHELTVATGILRTQVERALGELAGAGLVTADSFSGLRALLTPSAKRRDLSGRASARRSAYGVDTAGRWALLAGGDVAAGPAAQAGTSPPLSSPPPSPPFPLRGKGDISIPPPGSTQDEGATPPPPPPLPLRGRGGNGIPPPHSSRDEGRMGKGDSSLPSSIRTINERRTETLARTLLKRYGIVFRSLLARETNLPP